MKTFVAGLMIGLTSAISLVFFSPSIQNSITWRSQTFLGRASSEQINFERSLFTLWGRGITQTPAGSVVLLGDSHLQGIQSSALGSNVVNLAIGGITAQRLEKALAQDSLRLPPQPAALVLLIGHNDLSKGVSAEQVATSTQKILSQLPKPKLILIENIPRVKESDQGQLKQRFNALNASLASMCSARSNCKLIQTDFLADAQGDLRAEFVEADRIHLSSAGYAALTATIKSAM
jgi:lysophospholipase L1-like esterase